MFSAHLQAAAGIAVIIFTLFALVYEHAPNLLTLIVGAL